MTKARVIGAMIPDPPEPAREECRRWIHVNLGDIDSYPPLPELKNILLEEFTSMVLGESLPAELTSGATESNILALFYWRRAGKKRVIGFPHTHYSVRKAADLLGMEYVEIKDIADLGPSIRRDSVVVATLGTTETGEIDDISFIADEARRVGAGVHVDAAFYGPMYRYKHGELELDEVVATLAVDLHKIPEAPPPAGVLIAYDYHVLESLFYDAHYIPSKKQFGILGTRPGCVVPAALLSLRIVVTERPGGPRGLAQDLDAAVEGVVRELSKKGYTSIGGPAPVRCLKHEMISEIITGLEEKGLRAYRCLGDGIRIVLMPHHLWQGYNWLVEVLSRLAERIENGRPRRAMGRGTSKGV